MPNPFQERAVSDSLFVRKCVKSLGDYFVPMASRGGNFVHFSRICGWSGDTALFVSEFCRDARTCGCVIDGRIPNPDGGNIAFFEEHFGKNFRITEDSVSSNLPRWLPSLRKTVVPLLSRSIIRSLSVLSSQGKPEGAVRSAFVKFMCWLYYRFPLVVSSLGSSRVPKIIAFGDISAHELLFVHALVGAGCDAVLVCADGGASYSRLDPSSTFSDAISGGTEPLPDGFPDSVLRGAGPSVSCAPDSCAFRVVTNAYDIGDGFCAVETDVSARGSGENEIRNVFCRIDGAEDRNLYEGKLLSFRRGIEARGRNIVVVDGGIPRATTEEIARIRRGREDSPAAIASALSSSIQWGASREIESMMRRAFSETVFAESKKGCAGSRLVSRAVTLCCYVARYAPALFRNMKLPSVSLFIQFGAEGGATEAAFLSLLSRLPVDVLILRPDLNSPCDFSGGGIAAVKNAESVPLSRFPAGGDFSRVGTVAFRAERDLDGILYTGTGLFREKQHSRAEAVILRTTADEIPILWGEEARFRPNFRVDGDVVGIPVIFAKISGVDGGDVGRYWRTIGSLSGNDAFVVRGAPFIKHGSFSPMARFASEFYRDGRLRVDYIKAHPDFPYRILRGEMQDFILEKLSLLIERKLVRGIGENGTEYLAVSTILNMPGEIVRLFQNFDFTKKSPKFVYVNAGESEISVEDSILSAFLVVCGFDVVFFVPTGYRSVEGNFRDILPDEHVVGDFVCGLSVPDEFPADVSRAARSIFGKFFRRR